MKLSVGIIGLPNVGKSTLFKLLTKQEVLIANYPFATIDPNVGIVPIRDARLDKVAKLINPKKVVPAVLEFYDIAGLVKGAHKGEGLGNKFLGKIREVSVIAHVVRLFERSDVPHTSDTLDPIGDIDVVNSELILKDLETVEKRLEKAESDAKTGDKKKSEELNELKRLYETLNNGGMASAVPASDTIEELFLLTAKPQVFVLNGNRDQASNELIKKLDDTESKYVVSDLEEASDLGNLVWKAYEALGLITFFTVTGGEEERAWAIQGGTSVRDAAGEVHTDFKEKFIRAEVISWEKLLEAGGWQEAKGRGLVRAEGKEYVVQDGDVLLIKHS